MAKEEDASVSNLFKEIDDELRQDKATQLWQKYGNLLIGAIIAVILGVAAFEGWKSYDLSQRSELGEQYAAAMDLAREDNFAEAQNAFQTLADQTGTGYSVLARMQAAALMAEQGKAKEAADAYFLIAQNGEIDPVFRDMALIMGALNGLEVMDANDIINRLQPLVGGANPWRHAASELTAYAHAKAGNMEEAHKIMSSMIDDASVPPGMRQRANEFAQAYNG
ncbi:MAG: tetratricopeptide repeat protein [Methylocystaceae bacterium]|nr:tetratricopeptide repeat protein [Methylocystaceae bacterium]